MLVVGGRLGAGFALIGALSIAIALLAVADATAVTDATAPVLTLPAASTTNATSPRGAIVSFIAVATDDVQPTSISCTPASGSRFPIGTTNVACTALDAAGHTTSASFAITVLGAADQLAQLRSAVIAAKFERKRQSDLLDELDAAKRALDRDKQKQACKNLDDFADALRDRGHSGETGQSGLTTQNGNGAQPAESAESRARPASAVVSDLVSRANAVQAALDCISSDAPPVLLGPRADINATTAPDASTATIRFTGPSSSVTCTPTSPATLGVGTTKVTCTATNSAGSTKASFFVTVADQQKPVLTLPADIVVTAPPGSSSVVVTYVVGAIDNVGVRSTVCAPVSGSAFPRGLTTVSCTATDTSGNTATGTFKVTVNVAISGRITDRATGLPIAGVAAAVFDVTNLRVGLTTSGSDGTYTVVIVPGTYRVFFNGDLAKPYTREWWNHRADVGDDIVVSGSVGGINAALTAGVVVHGRATDESTGSGIANVSVSAVDPAVPCCRSISDASTDASGNYQLVVPGGSTVKVQFTAGPSSRYMVEWWNNKRNFTEANPLTVTGETFGIDAALTPAVLLGGRVTDEQSGAGIGSIAVVVTDSTTPCCPFGGITVAATSTDGTYSVLVPKGRPIKIQFLKIGSADPQYIGEWFDNQPDWDHATVRSFAADTSGIDAALARGFFIRGNVTRRDTGAPIEGLYVNANDGLAGCCRYIAGSRTGPNGDYAILVHPGSYKVLFFSRAPYLAADGHTYIDQWWNGAASFEDGAQIVINGNVNGINAVMTPAVVVSGHVTDASGTFPVAGFQVNAIDATVPCCHFLGGAETDTFGNYSIAVSGGATVKVAFGLFSGPPPGSRYLGQWWNNKSTFEAADPVVVDSDRSGIDAHLRTGFVVSGHVSESGNGRALPDVQVQVIDPAVPCCPFLVVAQTRTNASGDYAFVVAAGSYKLQFFEYPPPARPHLQQWWRGEPDEQHADVLAVTGDRPNIDAVLTPAVAISGRVTDATGVVPIVGFQVNALDAAAPCCQFFGGAQTDAQGNYSIALPIGSSVKVSFGVFNGPPPGTRYLAQWWNNKPTFEAADLIFAGADVPNIDARLANGFLISGHVSERGGGPLSGVQVSVIDPTIPCCPFREFAHAQTNTTGDYSAVVPSGSYKVQFFEFPLPAHPHMQQWWQGKQFDQGADVLMVTTDRPNIDAVLTPAVFIRGRVTDATGAVGIGGVNVSSPDATLPCCQFISGSQTDVLGNYSYAVPLGSLVKVEFGAPFGSPYVGQWWNNRSAFDSADPIRADADNFGIDARLASGSFISGHVTDVLGQPLAGVTVNADDAMLPCCRFLGGAETDAFGNYRLSVPSGSHVRVFFIDPAHPRLMPRWWNDKAFFDGADIVDVTGDVSGINARLRPGVLISGRVTDATGTSAVSGLNVSAQDASLPCCRFVAGTQTDALGNYTLFVPLGATLKVEFGVFGGSPAGTRYLGEWWNDKPTFEQGDVIAASADVPGIDARLARGFLVTGRVTERGTGVPLPGIHVQPFDALVPSPHPPFGQGTATDALGNYTLVLPQGPYKFFFESPIGSPPHIPQWWVDSPSEQFAIVLGVGQDSSGIDAALQRGVYVQGRVTDTAGVPIPGAQVNGLDALWSCGCQVISGASTDAAGNYSLLVSYGTQLKVRFQAPATGFADQWWNNKPNFGAADVIDAVTNRSGIDARFGSGGPFVVTGHVSERGTGIALSGIRVVADDANVPCCPPSVADTVTDALGNYSLTLPAGRYKLLFYQFPLGDHPHYFQWWHDRMLSTEADVLVVSGPTTGIDQEVPIAVWISGRVTDATGAIPVVGLEVSALNAAFGCCRPVDGAQTDAGGNYRFIAPIGTGLKIQFGVFGPPGAYVGEWWNDKPTYETADVLLADADRGRIDARLATASASSISGHVSDRATGLPISNVDVEAFDALVPCCAQLGGVRTNANGDYTITFAGAATVKLIFQSPDSGPVYVARWWHDRPDFWQADQIVVNRSVTNIDQALDAGYRIRGRVTDAANPAIGVPNVGVGAQPNFSCCFSGASTQPDGRYSLVVSAGTYRISFFAPYGSDLLEQWWNGKPSYSAADLLTVPSSTVDLSAIDAVLVHGIPIHGRVTDEGGLVGIDGVSVVATLDDPVIPCCVNYFAQTDAVGNYTMYVRPGRYRVNFQPPNTTDYVLEYWDDQLDYASATLLDVTGPTFDINAALARGFHIRGRVTDATGGAGVSGATVQIISLPCCGPSIVQLTAPDGTYNAVVRAGSYKIGFNPPFGSDFVGQYWNGKLDFNSADTLVVLDTDRPNVDGVLSHGVHLSGRVTEATDPTRGIAGVNVSASTSPGLQFVANAATMADGTYSLFVVPGTYILSFSPPFGSDFLLEYWNDKPDIVTADPINVTGPMADLDAGLARGVSISGRLTDEAGAPIPGIFVNVVRSELPFTFVTAQVTDADGRYSMKVYPGSYKLFFGSGVGVPFISEWWRDKFTFETADVIVASSAGATADGVLTRGVLITGRVTVSGSGAALSGALIYVYDATQPCCVNIGLAGTGSDGTYSFALTPGSYWVRFIATGYAEQWWNTKTDSVTADILSGAVDHLNVNAAMVPSGP